MKKLVFAFVLALASFSLVTSPMLRAQDTITIKDPAEYNTYQNAFTQKDPTAKAAALESFLTAYPQSVVKNAVLDNLIDTYQGLGDADKTLSAATRLLQAEPANMKAIFWSVLIKKNQCAKTVNPKTGVTSDPQTCDDAAALAQRGLTAVKPAATSPDEWKKLTAGTYPTFHSAIALDDVASKKDTKAGISEYRTELMLYTPEQTTSGPGLQDTLQLAGAYTKPDAKDLVQAVWFYSRAWNFVPPQVKPQVEKAIEYYYTQYHGKLDGLDDIKTQAAATVFPSGTFVISPAPTPAELAHKAMVETSDLSKMALVDTEFILANGTKEDTDKLWAVLKDQVTPVPGTVIDATASVIKVAVTQDAKDNKVADFVVNLKKPLLDKEIPAAGFVYKIPPATALVGTYDSFTQVPGTDTTSASVQIVLRDGETQVEKKKAVPAHKPAAGHHTAN
ncbi:MAG: hypothetical protein ABSD72_16155 [Terracidiphilus sp.]|jgi:hypothetical protein